MRESRAYQQRGGTGWDVDKVSALQGSIDTRESITNLPRGHLTLSTDLLIARCPTVKRTEG